MKSLAAITFAFRKRSAETMRSLVPLRPATAVRRHWIHCWWCSRLLPSVDPVADAEGFRPSGHLARSMRSYRRRSSRMQAGPPRIGPGRVLGPPGPKQQDRDKIGEMDLHDHASEVVDLMFSAISGTCRNKRLPHAGWFRCVGRSRGSDGNQPSPHALHDDTC